MFGYDLSICMRLIVSIDVVTSHFYHTSANTAALLRYVLQVVAMTSRLIVSLQFPTTTLDCFLLPCLLA